METGGGGAEGAVEGPQGQVGELGGGEQVDVDVAADGGRSPLPFHPASAGLLQLLFRASFAGEKSGGDLLSPESIDGGVRVVEAREEAVDEGGNN